MNTTETSNSEVISVLIWHDKLLLLYTAFTAENNSSPTPISLFFHTDTCVTSIISQVRAGLNLSLLWLLLQTRKITKEKQSHKTSLGFQYFLKRQYHCLTLHTCFQWQLHVHRIIFWSKTPWEEARTGILWLYKSLVWN